MQFTAILVLWPALCVGALQSAQGQILTLAQALDAAVQYHPALRGAVLQSRQQQQLLPAATALPYPVVTAESPTGNFYAVGAAQSFELPGAYRRRKALQQGRIARAESDIAAVRQEVRYATALAYNELQYRMALAEQLRAQDSTLQAIAAAAARMFEQGRTDAVASQFAALQAAVFRSQLRQAEQDARTAESQLRLLTGLNGQLVPESWPQTRTLPAADSASWQNNPALQSLRQETIVAERQATVEKSAGLPQITLGYLNQGERNSPVGMRFNAGVSVPLWRRQYKANVAAAQTGVEIARQNLAAETLQTEAAWRAALGEAEKARRALEDYETNVLPAAQALSGASRRLYEGGLSDLPAFLRNRKDALDAELVYWGFVRDYREAQLTMKYLEGNL